MYNWSVDEEQMKKADPKGFVLWRLEQMINCGSEGEKLPEIEVRQHWAEIKDRLDPSYRAYLESLLWPQRQAF